jgi:antitoxin component YwqK of YwqJK toxin-antitoxin module
MKLVVPILLLSLLGAVACSDETKSETKTIYYPGEKQIKQQIEYLKGKKNGLFIEYFRNGLVKAKQHYLNDTLNDSTVLYHENGNIETIQMYDKGLREGCWKRFNKNGELYWKTCFHKDKMEGEAFELSYRSLKPLVRFNYRDGDKHGKQETFYPNGNPESLVYYSKGFPRPGAKEWYENGKERNTNISFTVREKNTTALDNTLRYYITLSDPQEDDVVYEITAETDTSITAHRVLPFENGSYLYEEKIYPGASVLKQVKLMATRSSVKRNAIMQRYVLRVAGSN